MVRKMTYEIFCNKKLNVLNLHLFGTRAFVWIPEEQKCSKFNPKAIKFIKLEWIKIEKFI